MCVTSKTGWCGAERGPSAGHSETKDEARVNEQRTEVLMGKSDVNGMGLASMQTAEMKGEAEGKGGSSSPGNGGSSSAMTLEAALLEVEARFLLNLPEEELSTVDRLFFQMEQAHWYYEDFLADQHAELPHFHLEGFTLALFQHSAQLRHLKERHADLIRDFHSYKYAVPVYGCVLLNPAMDKLVLVCNWEGTAWGLPRGKVNEGEHPMDCAVRETLEECGYDATGRLKEKDRFTIVQNAKRITLYIVKDVPEDFAFLPRVRKEVSEVRFFGFDDIPRTSYNVQTCLAHLRRWMAKSSSPSSSRGKKQAVGTDIRTQSASPGKREGGKRGGRGPSPNTKGGGKQPTGCVTPGPRQGKTQPQQQLLQQTGGKGGRSGSAGRARSAPVHHDTNDANNVTTFGVESVSWGVDAMFRANEQITGRQFTYDGNPQRFGEYDRKGKLLPTPPLPAPIVKTAVVPQSCGTQVKAAAALMKGGGASLLATATGSSVMEAGAGGHGLALQTDGTVATASGTVEADDHLDGFQFDTQDILAALHF